MPVLKRYLDLIALEISKVNLTGKLPAGVVVTGGGALTSGVERMAKYTLKVPTRIGVPKGVTGLIDEIQSPASAAVVGTVLYGSNLLRSGSLLSFENNKGNMKKSISKIIEKFKSFLP
jgi:cell division protein FtsA